jgi:5-methylcytosine-specific restriction protein B
MIKYYKLSVSQLVDSFSRIESGNAFDFTINTSEIGLSGLTIANGDVLIASNSNNTYYNFEVVGLTNNELHLIKSFEIQKNINFINSEIGVFEEISESEYNSICSQLFSSFSKDVSQLRKIVELDNLKERFVDWFIKLDGTKHNYFSDSFSSNREKLIEHLTKYENLYNSQFGKFIFNILEDDASEFINELEKNIYLEAGDFFQFSLKNSTHMPRAILGKKNYIKFLKELFTTKEIPQSNFDLKPFQLLVNKAGLKFSPQLIRRFIASLCTKPFVICSGLSGSGKTKLAQAFVQWISESDNQYKIIPVGADWTNREPLLGYPNGLDPKSYVTPDSGALQLILEASKEQNLRRPYFMILDEMNLSHVERYFADFLSIMESGENLKLYSGEKRYFKYVEVSETDETYFIPHEIKWPSNLFIIGTVNIDETTYMFSPKVLDRANVIEFRITTDEMKEFFKGRNELNMNELFLDKDKSKGGSGQKYGEDFFNLAKDKTITKIIDKNGEESVLNKFFAELQIVGSEFGYRSATEIELLMTKLGNNCFVDINGQSLNDNNKIDIAIMQKLLPKLHGSRKKLVGPLETLAGFCLERINESQPNDQNKTKTLYQQFISEKRDSANWGIKYSISFEKIERMLKNVIENGFTSYAEA